MLSREATNINFIVFGLTQSGFEPTIYRTRDEYANYYTTDVGTILKMETIVELQVHV
jgi:hypothetical protein